MNQVNFYKDRVALNVLAGSVENAKDCYEAGKKHVVVGVLSINYPTVSDAVADMKKYQDAIENALSVGLGAGNPKQSQMVVEIAREIKTQHYNQVFTGVGKNREAAGENGWINGLVSPSGTPGYVYIGTGEYSSAITNQTPVSIETAIALLKDMGGNSLKFFPMKGLNTLEEYKAVCAACAKHDFALEPTGGIDLDNFQEIVKIALDAGVKKIIPHVYSSIIDSKTGLTRPCDVEKLWAMIEEIV